MARTHCVVTQIATIHQNQRTANRVSGSDGVCRFVFEVVFITVLESVTFVSFIDAVSGMTNPSLN